MFENAMVHVGGSQTLCSMELTHSTGEDATMPQLERISKVFAGLTGVQFPAASIRTFLYRERKKGKTTVISHGAPRHKHFSRLIHRGVSAAGKELAVLLNADVDLEDMQGTYIQARAKLSSAQSSWDTLYELRNMPAADQLKYVFNNTKAPNWTPLMLDDTLLYQHYTPGTVIVERQVSIHENLTVTVTAYGGRLVRMRDVQGIGLTNVTQLEELLETVRQARPCKGLTPEEYASAARTGEHTHKVVGQGFDGEHAAYFSPACEILQSGDRRYVARLPISIHSVAAHDFFGC
jgi:hypothetical protein